MNLPEFLNPFMELASQPKGVVDRIMRHRKEAAEAKAEYEKVMASYRGILKNPAYGPVMNQALKTLGRDLSLLVQEAAKCGHCVKYAARVNVLQDIVLDPLEQVWREDMRLKSLEVAED